MDLYSVFIIDLLVCVVMIVKSEVPTAYDKIDLDTQYDGPEHPPVQLSAPVGGYTVFNCELDFPTEWEIPYILNWQKNSTTIYWRHENKESIYTDYINRVTNVQDSRFGGGSINITDIRESDKGWYECKVIFTNRSPASRNNGSWFYLDIEASTSSTTETTDTTEALTSTEPTTETQTLPVLISPPEDLSIHLTADGYLLSWTQPEKSTEKLRVYIVRLFKGTSKYLVSSEETKHNYFLFEELQENEIYHFQVSSLSTNDNDAPSSMISVHVPDFQRIRIAVAGVGCVLLLILVGAVIWYSKIRTREKSSEENVKKKISQEA